MTLRAVMSLHKLSAGDGYPYLTRQVAAADDTHRGRGSLGAYASRRASHPATGSAAGSPHSLVSVPQQWSQG